MSSFLRTILVLLSITLLVNLASITYQQPSSASYDISIEEESSSSESCELEDDKFFGQDRALLLSIRKSALRLNQNDLSPLQNFAEVPTSPPNA